MASKFRTTFLPALVIIGGFIAVFFLTGLADRQRPPLPANFEDDDLALNGSRLKGFVFGAEGLVADWYWMNSLQYMGKKISSVGLNKLNLDDMRELNPRLLYPMLENATDMDQRFMAPYTYGATLLPAIDSSHAIALTEKGIANNPTEWRLYQFLGYIYWKLEDYEKASEVYGKGSEIPGSPVFMRMMSARMKTEGGSRDLARDIYRQILAEAEDERSRENAELRLLQIDSLDDRDVITAAISEFRNSNGNRCPSSWTELLPTLQKIPGSRRLKIDRSNSIVDPASVPYVLDQKTCTVELGADTRVPRR